MSDSEFLNMVFDIFSSIVTVLKTITFMGVPLFYWIIGFLIMSAVIARVINTAGSPYVESQREIIAFERNRDTMNSVAANSIVAHLALSEALRRNRMESGTSFRKALLPRNPHRKE